MKKYFTTISIHFYIAMMFSIITVLLADTSLKMVGAGILICAPIWIFYLHRIDGMSSDEISEAFGFKGNKYFDVSEDE